MQEKVKETPRKQKRKKPNNQEKKPYRPAEGSANYAFMITLLQAHERKERVLTKCELMARTEIGGLCNTSIYGNDPLINRGRKRFPISSSVMLSYTGWSCISTLTKQKPPLAEIFGNPKKVVLTSDGIALAKDLRQQAIDAGRLKPHEIPIDASTEGGIFPDRETEKFSTAPDHAPEIKIEVRKLEETMGVDVAIEEIGSVDLPYSRPTARFDDEFEIVLVIDQREQFSRIQAGPVGISRVDALESHMELLHKAGIEVSVRQLDVGDAIWIARKKASFPDAGKEYILDWIVERKRVDDLAASIVDKRYDQQKYWLRKSGIGNIIYVVEGNPNTLDRGNAVRTATASTERVDGFRVTQTNDYKATLQFYSHLTRSIQRRLNDPRRSTSKDAITFEVFSQRLDKAKQLTHREIWGLMLTRIAGLGPDSVEAIVQDHPSPLSLYKSFQSSPSTFKKTLSNLQLKSSGRRLGAAKSKKLIAALFPDVPVE